MKNVIFDFGNVLARFYPQELTAAVVSDQTVNDAIRDIVFDRLYWDKLDDGSMREPDIKEAIRSRVATEHYATACKVIDKWVQSLTPVDGMPQLAVDLKAAGAKLYLLSNISPCFAEDYTDNPWIAELFSHFDGLVFSGSIGLVKPNREIFDYLLDRFKLNANECIFIDDNAKNIEAAVNVGIEGILFDGDAARLRQLLLSGSY